MANLLFSFPPGSSGTITIESGDILSLADGYEAVLPDAGGWCIVDIGPVAGDAPSVNIVAGGEAIELVTHMPRIGADPPVYDPVGVCLVESDEPNRQEIAAKARVYITRLR